MELHGGPTSELPNREFQVTELQIKWILLYQVYNKNSVHFLDRIKWRNGNILAGRGIKREKNY